MTIYKLRTPISEEQVRKLKTNDIVFLDGTIVTARDQAHKRSLELNKKGIGIPVNLEGLTLFHCGPVVYKVQQKWTVVAAGPTTSQRMEAFESEFVRIFKPRIIIGKGGMGEKTTEALKEYGAVYCIFTGGAAVLGAQSISHVKGVEWIDLGIPEAMWIFEVRSFGPLIVATDANGNNLFSELEKKIETNKRLIYQQFGIL